jgi:hypothetical protein
MLDPSYVRDHIKEVRTGLRNRAPIATAEVADFERRRGAELALDVEQI